MVAHVLWALALLAPLVATPAAAADWVALSDFQLIDGTGAGPRHVDTMLIRDGVIVAIDGEGMAAGPGPEDRVEELDLGGAHVIPGLIDTHVHLANYPRERRALAERLEWAVRGGVTTLRDLGGDARILADLHRAVLEGELIGPTIRFAAMFGGTSMFDNPVIGQAARGYEPGAAPWLRAASGDVNVPRLVALARGAGASGIKLYGDLDAERVTRIACAARRQGVLVWAHATVFPAAPRDLVRAGAHSLSHAPYLVWEAVDDVPADYRERTDAPYGDIPPDHPRILRLLDAMAARGIVLDATLAMFRDMHQYRPPQGIEWAAEAFRWGVEVTRLAHERGVPISVGTDAFFPKDPTALPNTHIELQTLVEDVGLSPLEAITAATKHGAIATGVDDSRGTVAPGMAADLVVLGSNPLRDIQATRDIRLVITAGRAHRPADSSP